MNPEQELSAVCLTNQIKYDLIDYFERKLKSTKIKINVENGCKHGTNFIGIVYRVVGCICFSPETSMRNGPNIFLKIAPDNMTRRKRFHVRANFSREIFVYNEILPHFLGIQMVNGIDVFAKGFHAYCECYHSIDLELSEALFLEDLKQQNFEMLNHRMADISREHACLVLIGLGRFHGLSFVLKNQSPDKFREFVQQMSEVFICKNDEYMREFFEDLKVRILGSLDLNTDSVIMSKLKHLFGKSHFDVALQCIDGAAAEPYAVICHGDCWNNNLLFKYDKNHKPIEVKFVDWQLARYASPVTDVMQFFFCSTTKALRDNYFDELIHIYHHSVSEMISNFNLDAETIFSFQAFQQQLHEYGKFGLSIASTLLPMLTSSEDSCPDLDTLAECIQNRKDEYNPFASEKTKEIFNKRMRDVIIDMDRLGYI